jgi:hypothetical protein
MDRRCISFAGIACVAFGCATTPIATIDECVSLRYRDGARPHEDRPAHVRAGSGLARLAGGTAVIQDDAGFIALVGRDGVGGIALPRGPGGRRLFSDDLGNKRHKLDLEACVSMDARVVAFGSGSTPARETVVLASSDGAVEVRDGGALYDAARRRPELAGTVLNIEGALIRDGSLLWFQRGNGAASERPVNAIIELAEFEGWLRGEAVAPVAHRVRIVDLGRIDSVPLSFTDATVFQGQTLFVAVAEASPDVARDGRVAGLRLGRLGSDEVELAMVLERDGRHSRRKLEGILPHPERPSSLLAVTDADDAEQPAELCEVEVPREWRAAAAQLNGAQTAARSP